MKNRVAFWSFVTMTPLIAAALLALGSQWSEVIGGRLLQVLGACLGLVWATGMFLIVGVAVTRLLGLGSEQTPAEPPGETTTLPPPRRRAA